MKKIKTTEEEEEFNHGVTRRTQRKKLTRRHRVVVSYIYTYLFL